jgi:hypothetical protein
MTLPVPPNDFVTRITANPFATVALFYAGCLSASAKAISYACEELKLTPDQAAAQHIGFSDRTLGKELPSRRIKAGREVRDLLESMGIYKANGRESLRGYVTVPITDDGGNIVGIRGHKVDRHAQGPETIVIGGGDLTANDAKNANEEATTKDTNNTKEEAAKEEVVTPAETELVIEDSQIIFNRDDRRYRIRGLEKNTSVMTLKVALQVSRDSLIHLDTLDLVKSRSRVSFIKAAASELYVDGDIIKKDIGALLLALETLQSDRIAALKNPKAVAVTLTEDEQSAAMELLRDPKLLERIVADTGACGMVGEATNKLAGYLAATSRKLDKPLAIVIQSSSSAGKTSLMDAILNMMPGEDVQRFSGMTGQSLFYLDSDQIRHKILAISEDEGIAEATYALKLLQSEGELRHATVGRGENGRAQTQEHHVEGPVQIFLTTTAMEIDEELVNRCMVLSVDESRNQTGAIQAIQRDARTAMVTQSRTLKAKLRSLHANAQRLIKPLTVFNPYAPQLTFANDKTRLRRDHEKYLTLIETIALLHQHQRTIHQGQFDGEAFDYINVERSDIAVANGIAGEVLGRSLDELSPQTRNLLGKMHDFVSDQVKSLSVPRNAFRFTRRDLREAIRWSDFQVRSHLKKLVDLEYVIVHRGRNGQRYVYELLYGGEGREGQPFLMGLIDPAKLKEPASTTKTPSITAPTSSSEAATASPVRALGEHGVSHA